MSELPPIYVVDLFPKLDAKLIELLKSLTAEDWQKPTVCAAWNVRDLAAHLLDTNLRRISILRDNFFGEKPENINSYQDLVGYLNELNAVWVKAAKRLSPEVLIELLAQTGNEVFHLLKSLDPHGKAVFPVAWAGESESANWFDTAREYTERWHHQAQIRLAVNQIGIENRELYHPVLETFMRALPFTYKEIEAEENVQIKFEIIGEAGDVWFLRRTENQWKLLKELSGQFASEVTISQEIAWRIFTKGIDKTLAQKQIMVKGDIKLGFEILKMLAIMA